MSVRQVRRWFGLGLVILVVCSQQLSAGNIPGLLIDVREADGTDYEVSVPIPAGEAISYSSTEDCGVAAHKTAAGNRFAHSHFTFSLPITGSSAFSSEHEVTAANIDRYHKAHFFASSRWTVALTLKQERFNCHGYALGYYIWIDDPTKIFNDDYQGASKSDPTPLMNRGASHTAKITGISGEYHKYVSESYEKNNYSKNYKGTWGYWQNWYPDSLSLYKKK